MKKSNSSHRWLKRQAEDEYVKRAKAEGWRSRAAFKLLEIQERDKIFKQGMKVVDLGAAPGGWSQVLRGFLGKHGHVYALDILPMDELPGVSFVEGDFREEDVLEQFLNLLADETIDVVVSDMSPNMSGQRYVDQVRSMYLSELALDFALNHLKPGGTFLIKVFQGVEFDEYMKTLRKHFKKVVSRKPKSSRPASREVYLLCTGLVR